MAVKYSFSQVGMAKSIFVPYWGIVEASFLLSLSHFAFPLTQAFRRYIAARRQEIDTVREILRSELDLSPGVYAIMDDEAPWASELGKEQLCADLSLFINALFSEEDLESPGLEEVLLGRTRSASVELASFYPGVIWCFGRERRDGTLMESLGALAEAIGAIAGLHTPAGKAILAGPALWQESMLEDELQDPLTHPDYAKWLAQQLERD